MNVELLSGFVVGIVAAVVALVLIMRFIHSDKRVKTQWDERQIAARGQAFMVAFWTIAIADVVIVILEVLGINPLDVRCEMIMALFLGLAVQICVSIAKDAYFGLNEVNRKRIYIVFAVFGVFELVMGVKTFIDEGGLNVPGSLYLSCAMLFVAVFVALLVKSAADKRLEY